MLDAGRQLGSTSQGSTFADIIINSVGAVASGQTQGFQSFLHDPKALNETVEAITKMQTPQRFIEAVSSRRLATQSINNCWTCPLNLQTPLTCPLAWNIVEANVKSRSGNSYEFEIMRTQDYTGRNYVQIRLPEVDTTKITINGQPNTMDDPKNFYLGAWHRDLVPRIIERVKFYGKSSQHVLFEYSGYDIALSNILFGNSNKEMNDLMAGEDKFEITYDPYRVDGSALGIASFKGVDTFKEFEYDGSAFKSVASSGAQTGMVDDIYNVDAIVAESDGFIDYFQRDKSMDLAEYRTHYRRNVWYEAPVAVPYDARHSIHSRRLVHDAAVIIVPLDVLPFGHSIETSLPTVAIGNETGYISLSLYNNWFDRAFYLTRLSDIPSLHPIAQHKHYESGDACREFDYENIDPLTGEPGIKMATVEEGSTLIGWVNVRSVNRYGDPEFDAKTSELTEEQIADDRNKSHQRPTGNVVGKQTNLEGIIPTTYKPTAEGTYKPTTVGGAKKATGAINRTPISIASTLDFETKETALLMPPSVVDKSWAESVAKEVVVKLLQVGYMSLASINALMVKLPNIYLTTEWSDQDYQLTQDKLVIDNDLYTMAIAFWFIPHDVHDIPSMRLYPHQKIDTEAPVVAGIHIQNEQSQGKMLYTWDMLNLLNPAHMGLKPLLSNMGIISFTPKMTACQMPYAIYDQNLNGFIQCKLEAPSASSSFVNMRKGQLKTISIGVNGIALCNKSMFRLVF